MVTTITDTLTDEQRGPVSEPAGGCRMFHPDLKTATTGMYQRQDISTR